MIIDGKIMLDVLLKKGVKFLYHANTVTTARTYLEAGGLVSRAFVEKKGLRQTSQSSDFIDKTYGIWNDIFFDSVDIHRRISAVNFYGPVLFKFKLSVLFNPEAKIVVMKKNPTKWGGLPLDSRYFGSVDDLCVGFGMGEFDHMITFHDFDSVVPFDNALDAVILDCPFDGNFFDYCNGLRNEFEKMLKESDSGIYREKVCLRKCFGTGCKCSGQYRSMGEDQVKKLFL